MAKPRLLVLFSGGRTSAYMTYRILKEYADQYEIIVCFANTGRENPETLDFVRDCDQHFGFNTVWLEAVVHHGKKRGCTHRVISYETADREGRVFEEMLKKYGIPNKNYIHCTRELKENVIHSYMRSIGWKRGTYQTAIGIRTDELQRKKTTVSRQTGQIRVYPLIDWFPTDKLDVLDFFEWTAFDLQLPDYLGNCQCCYKKSDNKLKQVYLSRPEGFEWTREMEERYGHVGDNMVKGVKVADPRVFFRGYRNTQQLIASFDLTVPVREDAPEDYEGCAASCEPFMND